MPGDKTAKKKGKSKIFLNVDLRKLEKEIGNQNMKTCYTTANFQTNAPIKRKVGRPLILPRS
jgi:ribosomal protein S6